jgi:galactokinase
MRCTVHHLIRLIPHAADIQPVLPMAIEQDILFAISPTSNPCINISNVQTRFAPASFPLVRDPSTGAWDIELTSFAGWESYMKAVVKQGLADFFTGQEQGEGPRGIDIVVSGNVPPGSGLSVCTSDLDRARCRVEFGRRPSR